MDIRTLQNTSPDALFAAADAYTRLADAFARHGDTWATGVDARVRDSGWTGHAADRAGTSLHATTTKLGAAAQELHLIAPVLREGAEAFLLAQNRLRTALADATADGYRVADDGSVSWPPPTGPGNDVDTLVREQLRQTTALAIGGRIAQILTEADHADLVTSERLRRYTDNARTGDGLDPATALGDITGRPFREDLVLAGMPPKGASPAEVNTWWKNLPPEEQQRLLQTHPQEIGNRDGIPSPIRDQANRTNLDRTIADLEGRQHRTPEEQDKLDGFIKVRNRLAKADAEYATSRDQPQPYLLAMSTDGQGRAALSFGNPDTADDVVAYVPGLGTKVGDVGGADGDRAKDLWEAAHNKDRTRSTASIVWLGYDAPQKAFPAADSLAVAGTARAEQGGEAYQSFLQGLRASHEGEPAHLTALGHSYGSLTLGQAAQRPGGIPVDDIILVGSPGTGARRAGDLGIDPGHVWVGAAENDPVTRLPGDGETIGMGAGAAAGAPLGPAGIITGGLAGFGVGHTVDPDHLWFGQDPVSEGFGANRFVVADGPLGFDSHSDYWKHDRNGQNSASLDNMADIVSGHTNQVERQKQR
ncbi:alpha/beta hydrolase [Kitasatospora sp. NPDC004531]